MVRVIQLHHNSWSWIIFLILHHPQGFIACFCLFQNITEASPSMASPSNGPVKESKGKNPGRDLEDQPKLRGYGKSRRSRFSFRKHLQRHGLAHADSVSSTGSIEESECRSMILLNSSSGPSSENVTAGEPGVTQEPQNL